MKIPVGSSRMEPIDWKYLFRRLGAYVTDVFLVYGLVTAVRSAGSQQTEQTAADMVIVNVVFALMNVLFLLLFRGRSPGKLIFGMRVEMAEGGRPGLMPLLLREITGRLVLEGSNILLMAALTWSGVLDGLLETLSASVGGVILYYLISLPWVLIVSASMIAMFGGHRAIHDRIAGTVVVSTR